MSELMPLVNCQWAYKPTRLRTKNTNLGQAPLVDTKQVTKKYSWTFIQNMNFHSADVLNHQTLDKRNLWRPTPQISMLKFKTAAYALGGFEFKVHSPVHSFSKATLKFGGRGNLFGVKCLIILYINSIEGNSPVGCWGTARTAASWIHVRPVAHYQAWASARALDLALALALTVALVLASASVLALALVLARLPLCCNAWLFLRAAIHHAAIMQHGTLETS